MNQRGNGAPSELSLAAFLDAAEAGDYVDVRQAAGGAAVIACGRMPHGREVVWLDPATLPPGMITAAAAFLAALESSYGARIRGIVGHQLDLPQPGQPLPAPLVRRVVRLAQASQSMLAGVNFTTRLCHSASMGGEAFRQACAAAAVAPESLGKARRALVDRLFHQDFDAAACKDTVEVDGAAAHALLTVAIRRAAAIDEGQAAMLAALPAGPDAL